MDDIKSPNTQNRPNPAAPTGSMPTSSQDTTIPDLQQIPYAPVGASNTDGNKKKGMRGWMVALLVVLALVIGGSGVYFWQTSSDTSDETIQQLQAQIDQTNKELTDLAKEGDTLTAENKILTKSNTALQTQVTNLTKACEDAAPTCVLP